jgi:hypothetical protein
VSQTKRDIKEQMQSDAKEKAIELANSIREARGELTEAINLLDKHAFESPEDCENAAARALEQIENCNSMLADCDYAAGDLEEVKTEWEYELEMADDDEEDE